MARRASAKAKAGATLGEIAPTATCAVKNLKKARKFYEETLGLKPASGENEEAVNYTTGDSQLLVYESRYAGTNKATAATWATDDVDGLVGVLKARGVSFERYDMPDVEHDGDIHVFGDFRAAWFKDPDGNIHAIISR